MGVGYLAYSATPDGRRANELLGELMIDIVWHVVVEPIMEGWYGLFSRNQKTPDKKDIQDVCRAKNIKDKKHFSDYLHKRKKGRRPDDNFGWPELCEIADDYLEEFAP